MVSAPPRALADSCGNSAAKSRFRNSFEIKLLGTAFEIKFQPLVSQTLHLSAIGLRFLLVAFSLQARLMVELASCHQGLWNSPEDYSIFSIEGMMQI
jgi:hypothetical protein